MGMSGPYVWWMIANTYLGKGVKMKEVSKGIFICERTLTGLLTGGLANVRLHYLLPWANFNMEAVEFLEEGHSKDRSQGLDNGLQVERKFNFFSVFLLPLFSTSVIPEIYCIILSEELLIWPQGNHFCYLLCCSDNFL